LGIKRQRVALDVIALMLVARETVSSHEAPAALIGPERSIETAGSGYNRRRDEPGLIVREPVRL